MKNIFVVAAIALAVCSQMFGEETIRRVGKPVPGEYVAVLTPGSDPHATAADLGKRFGVTVGPIWEHSLSGFAFTVHSKAGDQAAATLLKDVRVAYVEENPVLELNRSATQSLNPEYGFWGLDHIDENAWNTNGYPNYSGYEDGTYEYNSDGLGVRLYIVDSGVRGDHSEFMQTGASRVVEGYNAMSSLPTNHPNYDPWPANNPCGMTLPSGTEFPVWDSVNSTYRYFYSGCYNCPDNSHGTAVASVAAGATYGVAKRATVVPVTVFDCDQWTGTGITLQNGLEWIAATHRGTGQRGVVNLSVFFFAGFSGLSCPAPNDGGQASFIDQSINTLVNTTNLVVVASANNQGIDARCTVPARVPDAITVAGAMRDNSILSMPNVTPAVWSNVGPAIDLFAPAESIKSADFANVNATRTISTNGTSFASPFVAGCAARYLQSHSLSTSTNVASVIINAAVNNIVWGDLAGSANKYLYCSPAW